MDSLSVIPSLQFIVFISTTLLLGFIAMSVYLQRCFTGRTTSFWTGMLAPMIPLPWPYVVICLLWLALNAWFITWMLPIIGILLAALVIISLKKIPGEFWQLHSKDILKYFKISLGIFLLVIIPLSFTAFLSDVLLRYFDIPISPQPAIEKLLETKNKKDIFYFFFDASIFAPFWEEIVFRGFLYPMFKAKIGKKFSLVLTAIFFALVHFHLPTLLPLAFFGMILVWVYEKYGSLGYSIALHSIFNTFSATSILLLKF